MTNDAFEAMLRKQAKPVDTKGSYEQKLATTLDRLPEQGGRRWPVRRMAALVLAAAMLLACATGIAMNGLGFFDFWNGDREKAEELIEKGIVQSGGTLENAEFTVREAVFDGHMIQAVIAVRSTNGMLPVSEDTDLWYRLQDAQALEAAGFSIRRDDALAVSAYVVEVNGQPIDNGSITNAYEEDGTLVFLVKHALSDEDRSEAQVTIYCSAIEPEKELDGGWLTFTIPCVQPSVMKSDQEFDMEALTITSLYAAYTPLGVDIELTYRPGERLKEAQPTFVLVDGEERVYLSQSDRVLNEDGTYTMHMRFDKPDTLPGELVIGVNGLENTAVYKEEVE